jgi:monooxygenase
MNEESFDVLIIGAGVSGIGMACTLQRQCPGKSFAILERRERLGGTWDLFRYPGIRSDSDMFTYGYAFRPWQDFKVLADGETIRTYLSDTVREYGVGEHIRYGLKITRADWSPTRQRWTVTAASQPDGPPRRFNAKLLVLATGYYDHDAGYTPDFPGIGQFAGRVVHPQHWPQDLELGGKRVVVIGSGATAMTLVPAMAGECGHVTMLQRSPTYLFSVPARDTLSEKLSRVLPRRWVFALARRRNVAIARWLYLACRRWPNAMRSFLLGQVRKHLAGSADMAHFTPTYKPWDQRLCIVPDADLLSAIRTGKVSVVTGQIAGFSANQVLLQSGEAVQADILITATGLQLQAFGGIQVMVDGQPYEPSRHMLYRGVLMEDLPNCAWIVGYTNASWTLKADLAASYLCRLIRHMDARGLGVAVARDREGCKLDESLLGNLHAGYVLRGGERTPRQGRKAPWRITHDYPSDKAALLDEPVDDGVLAFEPLLAAASPAPLRDAVSERAAA